MRNMQKYVGFLIGINLILLNFLFSQTQKDVIKFSHKLHLENEVECETCHQNAANSQTGKDNLMPSMEFCSDCHDIEEENECITCHSNTDEPGEIPRIQSYSLLFSHEKHVKSSINCSECHVDINKKEFAGVNHLPDMDKCMDCHTKKAISNKCNACHTPDEQLRPVSHRGDFMHIHGQSAKTGNMDVSVNMSCSSCHSDNYCQNCHEGENVEKNIHPLNFEFTHSFKARGKEQDCMTCHTERIFCIECHNQKHIMPFNHGMGWINSIPGDGGFHKREAKIDLESCMVCHEANASSICQPCHGN